MARFYSYDEITSRTRTPVEDIQWLAGQIAQLPPFVAGSAVLCGSVSWNKHSWRSDIDVAHFSTLEYSHLDQSLSELISRYTDKTNNLAPKVDIITIGAESTLVVSSEVKGGSGPAVSGVVSKKEDRVSDVFTETAILFADHIGSIANLKGDPWRTFLERYLSSAAASQFNPRDAIKSYVGRMTTEWTQQPLHQLNLGPGGRFTAQQLDLISRSENYPVNLMRRILSDVGRYPRPDRISDVRNAFSTLTEPWAKTLLAQFEPFFLLGEQYEQIVNACQRPENPLLEADYYGQLRSLFTALPFVEIQNTVWEYVGS
jgi:hypothetical protein